ncbi:hypothetical protein QYF61_018206 [Mycteria americana]|uniref:Uncharacterized protein n=1 Tax=Mycteria americana TaxID=33587 RepID=A0AAN7RXX9_MYCAM|nr:hypothetical protein QYF61_018206 [Mycteria americana]
MAEIHGRLIVSHSHKPTKASTMCLQWWKQPLAVWKHILCPMPLPGTLSWALKSKSCGEMAPQKELSQTMGLISEKNLIDTWVKEHGIERGLIAEPAKKEESMLHGRQIMEDLEEKPVAEFGMGMPVTPEAALLRVAQQFRLLPAADDLAALRGGILRQRGISAAQLKSREAAGHGTAHPPNPHLKRRAEVLMKGSFDFMNFMSGPSPSTLRGLLGPDKLHGGLHPTPARGPRSPISGHPRAFSPTAIVV